jgi:multidrug efflux pump subunit AcrA (membrane-fusion protein)
MEKYTSSFHDMQVACSNTRSQLESARKELNDNFINADRDGVVYQTFKEAGEGVRTGETVALIGAYGRRIIRLSVDQEDIGRVRAGQRVVVKTDLTGNEIYEAKIMQIYPTMNESDQTFRVDAGFDRETLQPFIHGSVEANIIIQVKPGAKVLQRAAMADEDSVWTLADGKEKKVAVKTGISSPEYVEILGGLDENTPVLLKNKPDSK